ncbi:hypothetical protein OB03_11755 [Brevundimonas sp. GN22]
MKADQFDLSQIKAVPNRPLYKYLSLATGQSPTWQQRVEELLSGVAFLPSPNDFNDPFDCLPVPVTPNSREEMASLGDAFIERMVSALQDELPQEVRGMLALALKVMTPEELRDLARQSIAQEMKHLGVFCMAENHTNILMWSHYANHHRGIALKFDTSKQVTGGLNPLLKVQYQKERPQHRRIFHDTPLTETLIALCTKAEFWAYEQEWRLIGSENAGSRLRFDPNVITGLIFGAKISPADEQWLRERVAGREIELMRAVPSQKTFDLEIVPA